MTSHRRTIPTSLVVFCPLALIVCRVSTSTVQNDGLKRNNVGPQIICWRTTDLDVWATNNLGRFQVYGQLCSSIDGYWKGFDFWVDRWPDFTAVVSCPDPESCQTDYDNNVYSIFAKDKRGVEKLLYHPGVVDWKREIIFGGVPREIWDIIKKASKEHGGHIEEPIEEAYTFIADENKLPELPIPDEITVGSVSEDMAKIISENWNYSGSGSQEFIRNIIVNFPSVCLRTSVGDVVGYELIYPFWSVGFLYVMPNFRCQGYGKRIQTLMAKKLFSENITPWCYIDKTNKISMDIQSKIGFKELPDGMVSWLRHKVGPSSQTDSDRCNQKRCI